MLSKEELLKPRYKCIADYPKGLYKVGDILDAGGRSEDCIYCDTEGPRWRHYPHLFKPLAWWEYRDKSDMPKYVKSLINQQFYKVVKSNNVSFEAVQEMPGGWGIDYPWDNVLPATETEYLTFINKIK